MHRTRMWMLALLVLFLALASPALAHFGTIIPSDDIVTPQDSKKLQIKIMFMHPMENHYMNMLKPKKFGLALRGKTYDLTGSLKARQVEDEGGSFTTWEADYAIKRPGDYTFFVEPKPYWEPAEDKFIVHYSKVCVNAFGMEQGWDKPVGLETEIVPLTRPYGLWAGNVFRGRVLVKGKPAPNTRVEIEYFNGYDQSVTTIRPPSDPFVTQVVKTDSQGVFTYAMPKAGWWGFAALNEASWTLKHDGKDKPVEIGAVYWVKVRALK